MRERAEKLEAQVQERTLNLKNKNIELSNTLEQLNKTQEQLVMQEKLATLGQLTAGIAHEIKNPLNFVTNFAEGSVELTDELKEELDRLQSSHDPEEHRLLLDLPEDIRQNAVLIHDNGQRADNRLLA